tara:strand:+ start:2707 stop:2913 length:207 start_codon:yes stop_codon:yes gene_type:complete
MTENKFQEMAKGILDAEDTLRKAEQFTNDMAMLVGGKLRANCVEARLLAKLKRELKDFNLRTLKWRGE